MGSKSYSFLAHSLFFNDYQLAEEFKSCADDELEKELASYREFIIKHYSELHQEIHQVQSELKVFNPNLTLSRALLTQTALYLEQFILPDPLFALTDRKDSIGETTANYLGYSPSERVDRRAVAKAARFMKDMTPMVAGNFVKFFPLSYYFERPKAIPLRLPVDYDNNVLPAPLLEFFRTHAEVNSMRRLPDNEGWQVESGLQLGRGILVEFRGDEANRNDTYSKLYHLFETEFVSYDEATNMAQMRYTLPDTPPARELFDAWVTQSINTTAGHYYDRTFTEVSIASNLGSSYLCNSPFKSELLGRNSQAATAPIHAFTAEQLLNVTLPFAERIDITRLMEVRQHEADTFTNFRLELEKQFRELRTLTDPTQLAAKRENIFHELNNVQAEKIRQKMVSAKKHLGLNVALAFGGLAGVFATSGFSLLASAIAAGKGYKDYLDYKDKVKDNPAYLLWQAVKPKK